MFAKHKQLSITWWRHQMDTFSALLAICVRNSSVTGQFSAKRPVRRSFGDFFICAWINDWENNRGAGELRRNRPHCNVTVMKCTQTTTSFYINCRIGLLGTKTVRCQSKTNDNHDDVIKWIHFPHYWPFVWGIHRLPVNFPQKGQWGGALMFSLSAPE